MSTVTFDHVWLARTLDSPVTYLNDSLEEMAFHVAQDLEWVEEFKREACERLSKVQTEAHSLLEASDVLTEAKDFVLNIEHVQTGATNGKDVVMPGSDSEFALVDKAVDSNYSEQEIAVASSTNATEPPVLEAEEPSVENMDDGSHEEEVAMTIDIQSSPVRATNEDKSALGAASPVVRENSPIHQDTNMIPLKIIGRQQPAESSVMLASPRPKPASNRQPESRLEITTTLGPRIDYMEPINLDSPKKVESRNDSAYFSAIESPESTSTSIFKSSPRRSVAFASLPPRQPFAKKSLGARAGQSRASAFDGNKSLTKTPLSVESDQAKLPSESSNVLLSTILQPALLSESSQEKDVMPDERSKVSHNTAEPPITTDAGVSSGSGPPRPLPVFVQRDAANPFDTQPDTAEKAPTSELTEDDDWLPKFDPTSTSPKKNSEFKEPLPPTRSPASTIVESAAPSIVEPPTAPITTAFIKEEDKTPGPIKAAMQAASAKATSYLRQARTAFGSPSIHHTKVFHTTTPMQSPPKPRFKVEPQTPKIYPDLNAQSVNTKPSLIPSRSPRKSPIKHQSRIDDEPVRKSPRRSPKKGAPAMQSMAVIAARNASAKAAAQPDDNKSAKHADDRPAHDSPQKPANKFNPKYSMQPKAKPVNIRVATASQREIDQAKDRKAQPLPTTTHSTSSTAILSRSTNENGQLEYLSKSQAGGVRKPAVSRQIKALAAANQAKEKAEKDQIRREHQRKDMERKRHENAKRQADEDDKRKAEAEEATRKRKLNAEQRVVSSSKKQTIRPVIPSSTAREPHNNQIHDQHPAPTTSTTTTTNNVHRQSIKRPLVELEENVVVAVHSTAPEIKRQRVSEQAESRPVISKPVRVSLQKPSALFGQPGEPGYKKPGNGIAPTLSSKSVPVVDAVKFSNETIRFATGDKPVSVVASTNILPASELIELPEINSDYSDSDDDEPQKDAFEKPGWAETPELRKLLRRQQRIDPDDVFGPIPPLQMEEIFKGKERALARFRPRSSSANWSASDKLSTEEVTEYARAMGYRN